VDRSLPCRVEEQRSRGHRVAIHAGRGLLHRAARPGKGSGRSSKGGSVAPTIRATGTFDTAYVRGWTIYEDGVVGNLWVVRFAREQSCRSFTEWWMVEDA
jgi:hypothetical protein